MPLCNRRHGHAEGGYECVFVTCVCLFAGVNGMELFPVCAEGIRETVHPLSFVARQMFKEMLANPVRCNVVDTVFMEIVSFISSYFFLIFSRVNALGISPYQNHSLSISCCT